MSPAAGDGDRRPRRVGAFGSEGSFSEEAALRYVEREGLAAEIACCPALERLFDELEAGRLDLVCVPVANSLGGLVRATFEVLGQRSFRPLGQVELPVRHALLVRPGADPTRIEAVASHPQALLQCERYLDRHLPRAERLVRGDTASAARELADGELSAGTAVLASLRAARRFGLDPIAVDVQDMQDNRTTFLLLGLPGGTAG